MWYCVELWGVIFSAGVGRNKVGGGDNIQMQHKRAHMGHLWSTTVSFVGLGCGLHLGLNGKRWGGRLWWLVRRFGRGCGEMMMVWVDFVQNSTFFKKVFCLKIINLFSSSLFFSFLNELPIHSRFISFGAFFHMFNSVLKWLFDEGGICWYYYICSDVTLIPAIEMNGKGLI